MIFWGEKGTLTYSEWYTKSKSMSLKCRMCKDHFSNPYDLRMHSMVKHKGYRLQPLNAEYHKPVDPTGRLAEAGDVKAQHFLMLLSAHEKKERQRSLDPSRFDVACSRQIIFHCFLLTPEINLEKKSHLQDLCLSVVSLLTVTRPKPPLCALKTNFNVFPMKCSLNWFPHFVHLYILTLNCPKFHSLLGCCACAVQFGHFGITNHFQSTPIKVCQYLNIGKETKEKLQRVALEDYLTRCASCPEFTLNAVKIGWLPVPNATVEVRQVSAIQENDAQNVMEQEG